MRLRTGPKGASQTVWRSAFFPPGHFRRAIYEGKRVFVFERDYQPGDVVDAEDERVVFDETGNFIRQIRGGFPSVSAGACDFRKIEYEP